MAQELPKTVEMQAWLARLQIGDLSARDELIRGVGAQLDRLARKMLKNYPSVRRWADTGDVLQNAMLRLLRSLQVARIATMRDFYALAATQIRRELLDLARHFQGPLGHGANLASWDGGSDARPLEAPEPAEDREEIDRWSRFHEQVELLPAEEREVVSLVHYHGWTQAEVAELFQIDVRTVRRRWQSALFQLQDVLTDLSQADD